MGKLKGKKNRTPAALRKTGLAILKKSLIALAITLLYGLCVTYPVCHSVYSKFESKLAMSEELKNFNNKEPAIEEDLSADSTEIMTAEIGAREIEDVQSELAALPTDAAFVGFAGMALACLGLIYVLLGNRRFGIFYFDFELISILIVLIPAIFLGKVFFTEIRPLFWYGAWAFIPLVFTSTIPIYNLLLKEAFKENRLYRRLIQGGAEQARFAGGNQYYKNEMRV